MSKKNLIRGGAGDDILYGTEGDDVINGGAGVDDDRLYGLGGNDELSGSYGNDYLDGGKGNDWLSGDWSGPNRYLFGVDTYAFRLGDGFDYIFELRAEDRIEFLWGDGNAGRFRFAEYEGSAVIIYGDGGTDDDTVPTHFYRDEEGKWCVSTTEGGAGGGTVTIGNMSLAHFRQSNIGFTIRGGAGDNTLYGAFGSDTIYGGKGADSLHGGAGDDRLVGGTGNDSFVFGAGDGDDTIFDFKAGDTIHLVGVSGGFEALDIRQDGNDTVIRYSENDSVRLLGVRATVVGPDSLDFIASLPGQGADSPSGEGDNLQQQAAPQDGAPAGENNDDSTGENDNDNDPETDIPPADDDNANPGQSGSDQDDTLNGGGGDDTLDGGLGNDVLSGGAGNDTLYGGDGDDTLHGGAGRDSLYGGRGDDTLRGGQGYDNLTGGLGVDTFVFQIGDGPDSIADFEEGDRIDITGGIGGFEALDIRQLGTNTVVRYGAGESDTLTLQGVAAGSLHSGDFRFHPAGEATGDDSRDTGEDDTLSRDQSAGDSPAERHDDANHEDNTANNRPAEGNTLTGTGGSDMLSGGLGDDVLRGRRGDDMLSGNQGNDTVGGGKGHDSLDGGDGDDTLIGGRGDDTLSGGAGSDIFVFRAGDGNDIVSDFRSDDRIRLEGVSGGFDALDIRQDGADTVVRYGVGNTITLQGIAVDSVGAEDFLFV